MAYKINVGDTLPDFTAKDEEGNIINSKDLIGSPVVLYFYPKDETPGCTKEACSFRDNMEAFDAWDAIVIGVSPDSMQSHKDFIENHELNFTLLADENKELCQKFDVLQEKNNFGKKSVGVERTTFVIDPDGIITWIERPVQVEGHSERVLAALKELE